MQLTERIGDAAVKAKKLGLSYYGNNEWGKAGVVTHIQSGVNILSATDRLGLFGSRGSVKRI